MNNKERIWISLLVATISSAAIWNYMNMKIIEKDLRTQLKSTQIELAKKNLEITKYQIEEIIEREEPSISFMKKYGSDKVLGFKNNNPGNIKGKNWYGQIGTDKQGHAIFSSEVYGIRALAKTLINYEAKGIDTIEKIVSKYAEGNNKNYIRFLSSYLNVKSNEKLNIGHKLHELVPAIITFECGSNPYPIEYFILLSWSADL